MPWTVICAPSRHIGWTHVRSFFLKNSATQLLGEQTGVQGVLELLEYVSPDLLVLPNLLEGVSTLELVRRTRHDLAPQAKIVILSDTVDEQHFAEAIHLGVSGYLVWTDIDVDSIEESLMLALRGVAVFSPEVTYAWQRLRQGRMCLLGDPVQLTSREAGILRGLYRGLSREEIARVEGISPSTVKRNIEGLFGKLEASSQFALGAQAALLGLVP